MPPCRRVATPAARLNLHVCTPAARLQNSTDTFLQASTSLGPQRASRASELHASPCRHTYTPAALHTSMRPPLHARASYLQPPRRYTYTAPPDLNTSPCRCAHSASLEFHVSTSLHLQCDFGHPYLQTSLHVRTLARPAARLHRAIPPRLHVATPVTILQSSIPP